MFEWTILLVDLSDQQICMPITNSVVMLHVYHCQAGNKASYDVIQQRCMSFQLCIEKLITIRFKNINKLLNM